MIDKDYVDHVNSISIPELKEMLRIINERKYPEHKKLIEARIEELESSNEPENIEIPDFEENLKLNEEIETEFERTENSVREKMLKSTKPRTLIFLKFWSIFQIIILPIIAFAIHKDTFRYFNNFIFIGKLYYILEILLIVSYMYISISIIKIIDTRESDTFYKLKRYLLTILILNIASILLENAILNGFDLSLLWDSIFKNKSILFSISFYLSFAYNKSIETYYTNPDIILFDNEPMKFKKL